MEVHVNAFLHLREIIIEHQQTALARRDQRGIECFKRKASLRIAVVYVAGDRVQVQAAAGDDVMR